MSDWSKTAPTVEQVLGGAFDWWYRRNGRASLLALGVRHSDVVYVDEGDCAGGIVAEMSGEWARVLTPDEVQAALATARRETATACADQAVYRLGQFVTDEEREELRTDILRAGGAL